MKRRKQNEWQRPITTLLLFFALFTGAWAQITVTGTVIDPAQTPLPGVNVTIKGTTTGTITDLDGNYELEVPSSEAVLVFSMVGMLSEEMAVGDQTSINMTLAEDVVGLDEIVVVGYGTMKKSDVTGAIVSIKDEDLTQVKTTNVIESLQGKAAGVDISRSSGEAGAGFSIKIRGERSLSGSNDPLYIVDGIQYGGGIDINPSDIASIEILKDISSTAIYGSKGANGVVIITTKKGSAGKSKINFSTYHGWNTPLGDLPYMNSEDYLLFKSDVTRFREYNSSGDWLEDISVELEPFELEGVANGTDTRWIDEISRTGKLSNYFLSVAGGNEGISYNLSVDHTAESGMLQKDEYKRYTIRGGFDAKVTNFLNVGTNSIFSYQDRSRMSFPERRVRMQNPLAQPYDSLGEIITNPTVPSNELTPLWYFQDDYYNREEIKSRIFSSIYADIQILEGLKFRTTFNADISTRRNGLNERAGEESVNVEMYISPSRQYTWSNLLTFDKSFGIHHLQATGLHEYRRGNQERYRITGINPAVPNSLWYAVDGMDETSVALDPDKKGDDAFPYTQHGLMSFMGRINYTLLNKYIFTAALRTDGAMQLAEGNKWDYFPALSVGWNLGQESFVQSLDFVSSMKVRLGYGVSGNYAVPSYSSYSYANPSPLYYEFGTSEAVSYGFRPVYAGNPDLTWEKTASLNLGIDFGFIDNRISGNIDLFKANTTDLLQNQVLPPHAAIPSIFANVGEVETKGVEVMLHTINISPAGDGFKWTSDISFTRNREKIISLAANVQRDELNGWFVGEPIDVYFDYEKSGIWQISDSVEMGRYVTDGFVPGDIKVVNHEGDSVINEDDRVVLGTPRPDWYGSFNNRFEYKGFDLSVMIMARMGMMIQDRVMTQSQVRDDYSENGMKVDYWTPVNPTNESPRLDPTVSQINYYRFASTLEYTDGSWVKVRDITLGYTLPSDLLERVNISSLRIYGSLKNFFVLYSPFYQKGRYDPEMGGRTNWPVPKTFMIGLNLEF